MSIPGFTPADLALAQTTLKERFGHDVEVQEVETEVRLSPGDRELTPCPALFWKAEGCAFVLSKTGPANFRAMFYYSVKDRFGTGQEEYDNLGDCIIILLKVQEEVGLERAKELGLN